ELIDSHCHLADEKFSADLDAVVARARSAGLEGAMCILSADEAEEVGRAGTVRTSWPVVRFAAGVHPHRAGEFEGRADEAVAVVGRVVDEVSAVAIGEVGLDYHYDFAPRPTQQAVFERQAALAVSRGLPLVIHTREAWDDTVAILRASGG